MTVSPIWIVPVTGLLATLFWDGLLVLPAKLLTVFVHEIGHAVAAMAVGAQVEKIVITLGESGETIVKNLSGVPAFTVAVSAGYFGSALVGAALLNRGLAARMERMTLLAFSIGLAYVSVLFTEGAGTAFLTGIGWALAFLVPVALGRNAARATLLVVGTLLLWYCFFDLFDFAGPGGRTDADILADFLARQRVIAPDSVVAASRTAAATWAVGMALGLYLLLRGPILQGSAAAAPRAEEAAASEAEQTGFPGELTEEVELWLMERGLGADGQPLLPDGMELPSQAGHEQGTPATLVPPPRI